MRQHEVPARFRSEGTWHPRDNERAIEAIISESLTAAVTGFWQVTRYTAEGPVLLGLYGGDNAEHRARCSAATKPGASVLPAYGVETYQQAVKAIGRCNETPNDCDRSPSQQALLDRPFFRKTRQFYEAICQAVDDHPGLTIPEVVRYVQHHYASEDGAINQVRTVLWRGTGIDGVRAEWSEDGKRCRLYPRDHDPPPPTVGPVRAATPTEPGAGDETECESRNEDSDEQGGHV